jgi:XRE family transcriptional regulator, fatty acid utilization regulator
MGVGAQPDDARHFVYADELPRRDLPRSAVPVGLTCRFCERPDCNQRAAPSYKFAFAVDEHVKKDNFFSPITEADSRRVGAEVEDVQRKPGGAP